MAALITVSGGIIIALINVLSNRSSSPPPSATQIPTTVSIATATQVDTPVPTDTVPAGEPTSTPAPATETPVPTFTMVSPVALGQDWSAGCISSLWQMYPKDITVADKGDGCLQEPVYVFSAENGDLDFLADSADGPGIYGIMAPLPTESGTVTFHVRLRTLENVDLLMAVFSDADVNSQGLLMTIPEGNVRNRVIVQKDNVNAYTTLQQTANLQQGDQGYSITFNFSLTSIRSSVDPNVFVTNPVAVSSPKKWIFLGYKVLNSRYRVDATFFDLSLQ